MQRDMVTAMRCTTKTVYNAANMMPTLGEHTGVGLPVVTLFGRRGQAMSIDVFSNPSGNYNGICVGASGSGKSFLLNEITQRVLATGGKVWIIDVGRSYEKLCKMISGQYIEFTPDSKINLNPFSMITNLDEDMQLLKPMIGQMIAPTEALGDYELAQVEINIRQLWEEHGANTSLTMLAERLKKACYQGGSREAFGVEEEVKAENCDPRIRDLGVQLFPYTTEGAYGRFFDGPANINFESDFVVLELEELKSMKDLQSVVMLLIMYKIMQEMYQGDRKQRKMVVIDEAWDLMSGGQSGKFIEAGYRRCRKYNGSFITGTQSVADYWSSDTSKAAFDNADWMFLLRQKAESLEQLSQSGRLVMDDGTKSMLKSITTRHGAYSEVFVRCADMTPTIGRLFVDPFSQLVGSSKADDFEAVREYVASGKTTAQAVEKVLADRGVEG
jgi:conjugal transfer ATP-binding protein TraC